MGEQLELGSKPDTWKAKAAKFPSTTGQLVKALHTKYAPAQYAVLTEVRCGTGVQSEIRTADALVCQLYPSLGVELMGIEIKSSRADWLAETRDPTKSIPISRFCNQWWVLAAQGIVDAKNPDEVPKSWGVMERRSTGIFILKKAERKEPDTWTPSFMASVFRNLSQRTTGVDAQERRELESKALAAGRKIGLQEHKVTKADQELKRLRACVSEFEEHSGVSLRGYSHLRIERQAELFREFMDIGDTRESFDQYLDDLLKATRRQLEKLEQLAKGEG